MTAALNSNRRQAEFDFSSPVSVCEHDFGYVSFAYVPAGEVCCDCGLLLWQTIPESPDVVGYLTADWAWHHIHGKPWTTQPLMN